MNEIIELVNMFGAYLISSKTLIKCLLFIVGIKDVQSNDV